MDHSWTPEPIKEATRLGVAIASYQRVAESFQGLTKRAMSKSSLAELVGKFGGRLIEAQAGEAEATVKAPERGEEVVWREIPELDSEVMVVSLSYRVIMFIPDVPYFTPVSRR
jgi:hypothetical protein